MRCEENKLKISHLIDGEMPEQEADALRRHIESCQKCARYIEDLRAVRKALQLAPKVTVSPSFERRLESRLRRDGTGAYTPPVMRRMWVRKAVAAMVAAVVLIAIVLILSNIGIQNGETVTPPENVADKKGQKQREETPAILPIPEKEEVTRRDTQEEPEQPDEPEPELPEREELVDKPAPIEKPAPVREPQPEVPETTLAQAPPPEQAPQQPEAPEQRESFTREREPEEKPLREPDQEKQPLALKELERNLDAAVKRGDVEEQIKAIHLLAEAPADKACAVIRKVLTGVRGKKVKPEVRREGLFTLAQIGTEKAADAILFFYGDENWQVSDAVPKALSRIKRRETLEWLARERMLSAKSPATRKIIAEALGATGDTAVEDALILALDDKSWLVREAVLRGLSRVGTMKCVRAAIRSLNDPKMLVKEAAAGVLAENPDVRAVVPLVRLLIHDDIRLHGAVLTALWRITGKRFMKESLWRAWLKETGDFPETSADPSANPPAPASFLDIPLWSKSVIYLVDVSSSMRRDGKIEAAKQLIQKSIVELPEDARFNVVFFSSNTRSFSPTALPRADRRNKTKALDWLDRVRLPEVGRTNSYNALTTVLRNGPDDMIVISDGVPSEGRYVDPPRVVREIANQNLQQKTRIHAVGFYTLRPPVQGPMPVPVGANVDFLRDLAARNYGEFRYRWFNAEAKDE